jgi:hypothetical protein
LYTGGVLGSEERKGSWERRVLAKVVREWTDGIVWPVGVVIARGIDRMLISCFVWTAVDEA